MDPEEEDAENTSIHVLFYLYTLSIFVCCQFIEPIDLARKVNPHIRIVLRVAAGQKTKLRAEDTFILFLFITLLVSYQIARNKHRTRIGNPSILT